MLNLFKKYDLDYTQKNYFYDNVYSLVKKALKIKGVRTCTVDEFFLAWSLIIKYKPRVFLELGGQHGHSGIVFANAVKTYGGKLITVELGNDSSNKYPEESVGTLQFLPDNDSQIIKIWGDCKLLLPKILEENSVDMVFHDSDHTWNHVDECVTTVLNYNNNIIQMCHDCAKGLWQPDVHTKYGIICAERPIFDKYFLNENYNYDVFEDKYGLGFALPLGRIK